MTLDIEQLFAIIAVFIAFIGLYVRQVRFDYKLSERISALETKIEPFWNLVNQSLPRLMRSPHTPEFDMLLLKMERNDLDKCSAEKLLHLLEEETKRTRSDGKKLICLLMAAAVKERLAPPRKARRMLWFRPTLP